MEYLLEHLHLEHGVQGANSAAGRIAMASNTNGTLIAFYVDPSGDVVFTQQLTPRGRWAPWRWLTNTGIDIKGKSLAVAQNQDGRLELFLVGTGDRSSENGGDLLHCWQTSPGGSCAMAWTTSG
jgi:hypothetical protein